MSNVVFFSFKEEDRGVVLTIKGRAVNPSYTSLDFRVRDLLKRWKTEDEAVIKQAISKSLTGTSRTIVFVGDDTWKSYWVPHEVEMSLARGKQVYAIRLNGVQGAIPKCLTENGIKVYPWSEINLQALASI
ncbi:TIR domain-containing protein [Psychrobacter sp. SIMBA_152]